MIGGPRNDPAIADFCVDGKTNISVVVGRDKSSATVSIYATQVNETFDIGLGAWQVAGLESYWYRPAGHYHAALLRAVVLAETAGDSQPAGELRALIGNIVCDPTTVEDEGEDHERSD